MAFLSITPKKYTIHNPANRIPELFFGKIMGVSKMPWLKPCNLSKSLKSQTATTKIAIVEPPVLGYGWRCSRNRPLTSWRFAETRPAVKQRWPSAPSSARISGALGAFLGALISQKSHCYGENADQLMVILSQNEDFMRIPWDNIANNITSGFVSHNGLYTPELLFSEDK